MVRCDQLHSTKHTNLSEKSIIEWEIAICERSRYDFCFLNFAFHFFFFAVCWLIPLSGRDSWKNVCVCRNIVMRAKTMLWIINSKFSSINVCMRAQMYQMGKCAQQFRFIMSFAKRSVCLEVNGDSLFYALFLLRLFRFYVYFQSEQSKTKSKQVWCVFVNWFKRKEKPPLVMFVG